MNKQILVFFKKIIPLAGLFSFLIFFEIEENIGQVFFLFFFEIKKAGIPLFPGQVIALYTNYVIINSEFLLILWVPLT